MFLWNILNRDSNEMIRKVFEAQKVTEKKGDWTETIRQDKLKYAINLSDEEISELSKIKFKQIVDNAVKIEAIKHLNAIAESHSKSKYLMKPNLKREDYFNDQSMSRSDVELQFLG